MNDSNSRNPWRFGLPGGLLVAFGLAFGILAPKAAQLGEDIVDVMPGTGDLVTVSDVIRAPLPEPWRLFRRTRPATSRTDALKERWLAEDPDRAVLEALNAQGATYYSRGYPSDERIRELERLVAENPKSFYGQFYLASIYRLMGRDEDATRLRTEALNAAPVILEIPVRFDRETNAFGINAWNHLERIKSWTPFGYPVFGMGPMNPGRGAPSLDVLPARLSALKIYRYRTLGGRLVATQWYTFKDIVIDPDGKARIPFYSGKFGVGDQPQGLRFGVDSGLPGEMVNLRSRTFEARYERTQLPDLWVWERFAPSPCLHRSARESAVLQSGPGKAEPKPPLGDGDRNVEWTARATGTGAWDLTEPLAPDEAAPLPAVATNHLQSVDHAIIQLSRAEGSSARTHWHGMEVLDSRTKIPLTESQYGAGFFTDPETSRLHLFSLWEPLPPAVDVLLPVYEYSVQKAPTPMEAVAGAEARWGPAWRLQLTSIHAGEYERWTPERGFEGAFDPLKPVTQVVVDTRYAGVETLVLFAKDKEGHEFSTGIRVLGETTDTPTSSRIMGTIDWPMERIQRLEWRPIYPSEPLRVFVESVRLPALDRPLVPEEIRLDVPLRGRERVAVSDLAPLRISVGTRSLENQYHAGLRLGGASYTRALDWRQSISEEEFVAFRNGGQLVFEVSAHTAIGAISPILEPSVAFDFVHQTMDTPAYNLGGMPSIHAPLPFPRTRSHYAVLGSQSYHETVRDWRYTYYAPFSCWRSQLRGVGIRLSPRPWIRQTGNALYDFLLRHSPSDDR